MVQIRAAEPNDAAQVAELRAALWPRLSAAEHTVDLAAFFEGTTAEPEAVLVAVRDDAPVVIGFSELSRRAYAQGCHTSPVGYLEGWYVAPLWRGRGVGRALVEASEAWARAHGCREFASDAEVANQASAAAHAALGFEDVGSIQCFRKAL